MAGQPQAVYNLAVQPQAGQQPAAAPAPPAPAAAVGPYQFAADITNPYAMNWDAYSRKLKRYLDDNYPVQPPAPPRVAQAQAQAQAQPPEGPLTHTESKNRIRALNGGTPGDFPRGPLPAGWNQGHVNGMINRADNAVLPAIKNADPFNQAAYDAAMLAWLNTAVNQRWQSGPQGLLPVIFRI